MKDLSARSHTLVVMQSGMVWGFGDNNQGQLGQGVESGAENNPVPIYVTGTTQLLNVNSVSAGGSHAPVLLTNGQVVAIGENGFGQLGIGNYDDQAYPITREIIHIRACWNL